jgi:hypothetical protein
VDVVYIRTKLQALIALELLRRGHIDPCFVLVQVHQYSSEEDDDSVYRLYRELARRAAEVWSDVTADNFFTSLRLAIRAFRLARRTHGCVFNANLTMAPVALAAKLVRGSCFKSFDDGFANIIKGKSSYFTEAPLPGSGIKRRLLKVALPRGAAAELRKRTRIHYTVFPDHPNVVEADRLKIISIDWKSLLTEKDRKKLARPVKALLIGTKYEEWPARLNIERIVEGLADRIDLYLPHPREKIILHPGKAVVLDATAEAAVQFLSVRAPLRVYHLDSSVALTLAHLSNVEFVNVVPQWELKDLPVFT